MTRPDRADRGSTLIEMVLAIVLTGLVVVGLLAGIRTSIKASSVAYEGALLETVLINAGDRVSRAPQLCEYEAYVDAAAAANSWPADTITVTVEKLVANTGSPSDWATQACPDDIKPFDVQRMMITATTPDGRITRTMTVVKSNVG
jgi:hypothetical protein